MEIGDRFMRDFELSGIGIIYVQINQDPPVLSQLFTFINLFFVCEGLRNEFDPCCCDVKYFWCQNQKHKGTPKLNVILRTR